MIVKNEAAILSRCLDSVCDLMDEIIIVDTGSIDRTREIARQYTEKVYDFTFAFNPTYFSCGFWCFQYQYVYDTRIYKCLVLSLIHILTLPTKRIV